MKKRFRKFKKVKDSVASGVSEKAVAIASPKPEEPLSMENVPQITNETIAEHREEVLSGARKYIYPLAHSKRRIITVTALILIVAAAALMAYTVAGLYKYYQYNTFLYRVTQVVPLPVAKVGSSLVNYENYLFELRRQIHYYQEQQGNNTNDFSEAEDQQQLAQFRKQALDNVIDDAYIKILAGKNGVKVTGREVDQRINTVRQQNRLGTNDKVFADVLRDYWGWSISDFKRSLKEQILREKVTAKLDTETTAKAASALAQLKSGTNFADLAKQVSEDPGSKANGGDYGVAITKSNPNIPPQVMDQLFSLKPGQVSGIINTGTGLEIVKVEKSENGTVTARHITFVLKDPSVFINQQKVKQPPKIYIKL